MREKQHQKKKTNATKKNYLMQQQNKAIEKKNKSAI
jgi:hypothetical protein